MAQQGPGPGAAEWRLATLQGFQGYIEAILHEWCPGQELLQRRQVKADRSGSILVIISSWSTEGTVRNNGNQGTQAYSSTLTERGVGAVMARKEH